jgi:hypothetical protein
LIGVFAMFGTTQGAELPTNQPCGDIVAIRFFLPGEFKKAQAEARKSNRCMLIKGVAFGVDELGAKQPTKGHW